MHSELLRGIMKQHERVTHNLLAEESGLSVATCKNIMSGFLASGEVSEVGQAGSTGGRPSRQFSYNRNFAHSLLIYLRKEGPREILFFQIMDALATVISHETREFQNLALSDLEQVITESIALYPPIRVISLGIPGIVHNGVIRTCDIPSFPAMGIVEYLAKRYEVAVTAENDVNTTALGRYVTLSPDEDESFVYLYFPEAGGAGGGIVINGELIRGHADFAGEVSFLPGLAGIDQISAQNDGDEFSSLVVHMVQSVNCVINPARVVLSGSCFTPSVRQLIMARLDSSPQVALPPLLQFEEDIHESFLSGLQHLAMQELSCKFQIIKRN